MKEILLIGALLLVAGLTVFSGSAVAKEAPVVREHLLSRELAEAGGGDRVEMYEITMNERITDIPHRHPCPVFGRILEGKIVFQVEGSEPVILVEGDAFLEPAGASILKFDNLGPEPARFLACYLVGEGDGPLIEMLKSRNEEQGAGQ